MQNNLVSKTHDIITVSAETDDNGGTAEGKDLIGYRDFAFQFACRPDEIDRGVWPDRIGDTKSR